MLDKSTFQYLKPTEQQMRQMEIVREATLVYSNILHEQCPSGPDKTYLMRQLREVLMWANVGALVEAMKRSPAEGDSEIGTLVDATVNAYLDLHTSSLN